MTDTSAVFIGPLGGLGKAGKAASLIKAEDSLVKASQQMWKNPVVQKEADDLILMVSHYFRLASTMECITASGEANLNSQPHEREPMN